MTTQFFAIGPGSSFETQRGIEFHTGVENIEVQVFPISGSGFEQVIVQIEEIFEDQAIAILKEHQIGIQISKIVKCK